MRKLATIRTIGNIDPIDGADTIEVATIDGWKVVVGKNQFAIGDFCIYIEIDSVLPEKPEYEFLRKKCFINKHGFVGFRLKTIQLRGQISQGLVIPFDRSIGATGYIGEDVTELLGIVKYDPPVPAEISGEVSGPYPSFIPKTDQERIQNFSRKLEEWKKDLSVWEVTEKLDGTSMTIYHNNGHVGVCGRNWEFKYNPNHTMWKIADSIKKEFPKFNTIGNFAIQGELIGPGIQGNHYKLKQPQYYVYNVFNIDTGKFLLPSERRNFLKKLPQLLSVPTIEFHFDLKDHTVDSLLEYADNNSVLNTSVAREGLVFKNVETSEWQFKAISNSFLL